MGYLTGQRSKVTKVAKPVNDGGRIQTQEGLVATVDLNTRITSRSYYNIINLMLLYFIVCFSFPPIWFCYKDFFSFILVFFCSLTFTLMSSLESLQMIVISWLIKVSATQNADAPGRGRAACLGQFKNSLSKLYNLSRRKEAIRYVFKCFFFKTALLKYDWYKKNCTYLMSTIFWVRTCANPGAITTIKTGDIPNTSQNVLVCLSLFFCVVRTLKMRFIKETHLEVHNTLLLIIGTMLYSRSLELTHLL